MKKMSVHELRDKLDNNDSFVLLDVREPEEFEMCQIDGSILVPLSEIKDHLNDFDTDKEYVVHCKSGQRSQEAIEIMEENGFSKIHNLEGGILEWAENIDKTIEKY